METPNSKDFKLAKVKMIANGGLSASFTVKKAAEGAVYEDDYQMDSTMDIHPDLVDLFNGLKPILARVYHMNFFRSLMSNEDFGATQKQSKIAEELYQEIIKKISIIGVSFKGSDANTGIVITGTFTADTNQKMALNTHLIKFKSNKYGFEEDLEVQIDELKDEVYKYLFENKHAQLSLFDGVEEETEEDVAGADND